MSMLANLFDGVLFQIELKFKIFSAENGTNILKWKSICIFYDTYKGDIALFLFEESIHFGNSIFKVY